MNVLSREPVRVYLYGLALTIIALLVAYGIIDSTSAPLWLALVAAALAVPAVEGARSKVTPVVTAADRPAPTKRR